jgi:hypothetical protein
MAHRRFVFGSGHDSLPKHVINHRHNTLSPLDACGNHLVSMRASLRPSEQIVSGVQVTRDDDPCDDCQHAFATLVQATVYLFAFAGIWDRWKQPSGEVLETCSILTTTPNAVTSAVHDRMPVILDPHSYDLWLDPGMRDVSEASELLKPYDARQMRYYPVSARINYVSNDDETCSAPVELAQTQNLLF